MYTLIHIWANMYIHISIYTYTYSLYDISFCRSSYMVETQTFDQSTQIPVSILERWSSKSSDNLRNPITYRKK